MFQWLLLLATAAVSWADYDVLNDFASYQSGRHGPAPNQTYWSSNVTSPIFNYGTWRKDLIRSDDHSHLFLALDYHGAGPYIFRDDDLSLVYADQSFEYAMNARVQTFEGRPWLTFWHGARARGDAQGFCVFYDENYQLVWNVTTGRPLTTDADMHECEVTSDDTVLLTAYQDKSFDLSILGGKEGDVLADSCFQEIEIRTGEVLFTWCASDHFAPNLTYWNLTSTFGLKRGSSGDEGAPLTTSSGFDAYHINSLQKTSEGHYLVSLRNLWSLVYIDGKTGSPIWVLNGKENDFADITANETSTTHDGERIGLGFAWQHHARLWGQGLNKVTLFDNQELLTELDCSGPTCSRGKELLIDTSDADNPTVELVRDYLNPRGLKSVIFGSIHPLPYSHDPVSIDLEQFLISWGVNAEFSEHDSHGTLIRDVQYSTLYPGHSVGGLGVQSSRVYKQSWRGKPLWPPNVVSNGDGTLWVSWNGATEVDAWAVYGAETEHVLGDVDGVSRANGHHSVAKLTFEPLLLAKRQGFETRLDLGLYRPAFAKVAALNKDGEIIGYTQTTWVGNDLSLRYRNGISYITLGGLLV